LGEWLDDDDDVLLYCIFIIQLLVKEFSELVKVWQTYGQNG